MKNYNEYEEVSNPRVDCKNLGTMVCFHRRYSLGDKHSFKTTEDLDKFLKRKNIVAFLPLYLYDHSGITMATTPFHCKWDSGKVGYIYATRATARKMGVDPESVDEIKNQLISEVKAYDEYLVGA